MILGIIGKMVVIFREDQREKYVLESESGPEKNTEERALWLGNKKNS